MKIPHDDIQTLRLGLSAIILHGLLSRADNPWKPSDNIPDAIATADALITALGIEVEPLKEKPVNRPRTVPT